MPAVVRTPLAHTDRPGFVERQPRWRRRRLGESEDVAAAIALLASERAGWITGTRWRRRRLGESEDVAAAIALLASERAGWITGTIVDGGFSVT